MNAYKLADRIDITKHEKVTVFSMLKAAATLRHQADRIAELEEELQMYKELDQNAKDLVKKLEAVLKND